MRFLKNILIFSILVLSLTSDKVISQWFAQNPGTNSYLKSARFIDENTGWACGIDFVIKTTDGGDSWSLTNLAGYHTSIYFSDQNNGWICGEGGKIFHSSDGGTTWNPQSSGVFFNLVDLEFVNQNTGYAVGFGKSVLKTTNGGNNWVNLFPQGGFTGFYTVNILDENNIFLGGDLSIVFRTTDAGQTWDSISLGMPNPFFTVHFHNPNIGWAIGCCGMYFKTTDAGVTWTPETYITPGFTIYSSFFINDDTGWVSADGGYILRTTNGGVSWDSLASGTHNDLRTLQFVNDTVGWVVGYDGTILKTTNGGGPGWTIGIQQISSEIPDKFILAQNYPNPFNPSTKIEFSVPEAAFIELKVFDIIGREVASLVNERLAPGSYEYQFDASLLNSGVYFYTLRGESFIQTRKMLLLK